MILIILQACNLVVLLGVYMQLRGKGQPKDSAPKAEPDPFAEDMTKIMQFTGDRHA